jgi:Tfp pilus assembly protein PilN
MKTTPDLMLIPGRDGLEAWRIRGGEAPIHESSTKGSPGWVALPTHHTVSIPVRLLTNDPAQRQAAVHLELEAAGLSPEDLVAHRFSIQPVDPTGRDGSAAVFVFDGTQPNDTEVSRTLDSSYAPAAYFHPLQVGTLSLWRELDHWVVGIPHSNGSLLHAQALCSRELDADAAAELHCILAALELSDVLPKLEQMEIELTDADPRPHNAFLEALALPFVFAAPRPPRAPDQPSSTVPDAVIQAREDRRRQRLMLMSISAIVLVVVAALGAFSARLYIRQQAVIAERSVLDAQEPELQAIRDAQNQFSTLDPTLNRDQFVVEIFYQLVNLLPPEGIRITRFEVRSDSLIIDGEASSPQHAIDFRGELTGSEFFKEWGFDQGFAQNPSMQDGRATFRAEGRLQSPTEGEGGLVATQ